MQTTGQRDKESVLACSCVFDHGTYTETDDTDKERKTEKRQQHRQRWRRRGIIIT